MFVIGLGEIFVLAVIRPLRLLMGGRRTPFGRGMLRIENWILHHLHIMGAESRIRYEVELHGQASGFLAEGLSNQTNVMQNMDDTMTRIRGETGADHHASLEESKRDDGPELRRGQRQVESRGGERSDDIHKAMLEAQRRKDQETERARRRRR